MNKNFVVGDACFFYEPSSRRVLFTQVCETLHRIDSPTVYFVAAPLDQLIRVGNTNTLFSTEKEALLYASKTFKRQEELEIKKIREKWCRVRHNSYVMTMAINMDKKIEA